MDLKKIVMDLRNAKGLHGNFPIVVKIPLNQGHIVSDKAGYYVVAITKNNDLYFHGLSKYRMKYQPQKDFAIKLSAFKNYTFQILNKNLKQITLYNENDFLPFIFFANVKSSYESEYNASYMCKEFDRLKIKEINCIIQNDKELVDGKQE